MNKTLITCLLGTLVFSAADEPIVAEEEAGDETSALDDIFGNMAQDSIEAACLIYDDLTTWDLRPMSFRDMTFEEGVENPGEYFFWFDNFSSTGLGFSPCAYINWDLVLRPEAKEQIEHDTFAYWVVDDG